MTDVAGIRPRMSVVIPHYNHVDLLPEALDAIARQTMPPFEVVVVDDGSTDESVARLESLATKFPWLRICRHPGNRGVNAACNTGLDLVSGDFVLFSAADDRLSTTMIEHAFAAAAAFPQIGVLFSDHAEMSADGAEHSYCSSGSAAGPPVFLLRRVRASDAEPFLLFPRFKCLVQCSAAPRTRRVPARGEMARRPARGLCGCVRTWRRLHARRPVVCPHIADVLWRGRVAQQRSAGSLALLARADQTARVGAPPRRVSLRPRSGRIIACGRSAPWSKIPAMSRFDWQGGLFGCRSGPSWHRFSALAFAAGSVPSEHNIVAGYCTRIEVLSFAHGVAPATAGVPASSNSALELGASLGHYLAQGRLPVGAGQVIAPVGDFGSKQA